MIAVAKARAAPYLEPMSETSDKWPEDIQDMIDDFTFLDDWDCLLYTSDAADE